MSARSTASVALGSLVLAGCIAIPPLKLGVGGGASGTTRRMVPAGNVTGGVRPLALVPSLSERRVDVSVGAFSEHPNDDRSAYVDGVLVGPTAGVEGFPIVLSSLSGRVVVGGELRALYQPGLDVWAPFVAERIGFEIAGYVEGCSGGASPGGFGIGCGLGEGGIGVFGEVSQGYLDGRFRHSLALIVEVRIPAGAAMGIPIPR